MAAASMAALDAREEPGPALSVATFREVFDAHHTFVFRSLLHLGVADAVVDDAVQEVFVVVHRRIDAYDRAQPLRAWLWGIARHVAANQRRSAIRERRLRAAVAGANAMRGASARPSDLGHVRDALMALDAPLRDVLALADVEGMTVPEIASAIGANVNTVYSRLRAARQRFAAALERGPRGGDDARR